MTDRLHIAEWRECRGLTQAALADRVGINRVTVARIESGNEPKSGTLFALAAALDVTCEQLTEEPAPAPASDVSPRMTHPM